MSVAESREYRDVLRMAVPPENYVNHLMLKLLAEISETLSRIERQSEENVKKASEVRRVLSEWDDGVKVASHWPFPKEGV